MFRAMVLKELRETRLIGLLALAAYAWMVAAAAKLGLPLPSPFTLNESWKVSEYVPFINDEFPSRFCMVSAVVAMALGLWQTLGESGRGTYVLLFHRPATRRLLIGAKLFVGMTIYLACGAVPILAYGFWAATPGHHASPFAWSMTVPCWVAWFGIALIYLGAFLAGIRPGRWSRSRLLPLTAAILGTIAIGLGNWTVSWQLLLFVIVDIWLVLLIQYVTQERDYP